MLAFLAPAALKLFFGGAYAKAKDVASRIPPKGWLIIGLIVAAIVGFLVHQHEAHKALEERYSTGYSTGYAKAIADVKAEQAKVDAAARKRKARIETAATNITEKKETNLANDLSDIARDARALRVRGAPAIEPRRIAGGALPGLPGAAELGNGNAAREVPGLAEIPWGELVDHGEACDVDRAKLETLQSWIREQAQLHNGGNDVK